MRTARLAALQVEAFVVLVATEVLIRRRGTTAALQRLTRRRSRAAEPTADDASDVVTAVRRAGRLVRARCLAQSVAVAVLLERAGRDAAVVLGCRRYQDRRWGSHAWVVCDGDVLEPVTGGDHAELARYSASQRWVPAAPPASGVGA